MANKNKGGTLTRVNLTGFSEESFDTLPKKQGVGGGPGLTSEFQEAIRALQPGRALRVPVIPHPDHPDEDFEASAQRIVSRVNSRKTSYDFDISTRSFPDEAMEYQNDKGKTVKGKGVVRIYRLPDQRQLATGNTPEANAARANPARNDAGTMPANGPVIQITPTSDMTITPNPDGSVSVKHQNPVANVPPANAPAKNGPGRPKGSGNKNR